MELVPDNLYIDRGPPLPESYGVRRLVAMVKNPYWVYVYWDLPAEDYLRARSESEECVLRVHDLTDGKTYEVGADIERRRHYLDVGDDRSYVVEIGLRNAAAAKEDSWTPFAASQYIATPPSGPGEGDVKLVCRDGAPTGERTPGRPLRPRPGRTDKEEVIVTAASFRAQIGRNDTGGAGITRPARKSDRSPDGVCARPDGVKGREKPK